MPAPTTQLADKIAAIVMKYDADSPEARDAMDNLMLIHGREPVAQAAELVRAKVAG